MTAELPAGVRPPRPGDPRAFGRYEVVGSLGEGGMGRVFLGRGPDGVLVAIKVVRAELAEDPLFRVRFRREAASAMRVPRFCTAEVLDAGPDAAEPYLVTEYIEGPTLEAAVRSGGPLRGADLEQLAVSTAAALAGVHAAGIVHRDLKPANVLLSRTGPRVIDFGLAGAVDATRVTEDGKILGTPAYMAPEQLQAKPGPASDVFAWGGVMLYAATGRRPFGGASLPAMAVAIMETEPDLAALSGVLRDAVAAALAKDPEARPSPSGLLAMLGVTGGTPGPVLGTRLDGLAGADDREPESELPEDWRPVWMPEHPHRSARRRRWRRAVSLLTFLLSVVAIALVVGWALLQDRPREFLVTGADVRTADLKPGCGPVDVVGTITTNGAAGQIIYQWQRSGRKTPDPPIQYKMEKGSKQAIVHLRWEIGGTGSRTFTATLIVLNNAAVRDSITFRYSCRD
ncbi:hypothetical protein GCM10010191_57230 [Actinomadura vinacea]|uniref:Protein kinase domain-containing protein n=1 Tax=Actinomadura vinacea TaxID=115336 RepID=A0ABN3JMV3_9ACTN